MTASDTAIPPANATNAPAIAAKAPFRFSPANARELQQRAVTARKARIEREKRDKERLNAQVLAVAPILATAVGIASDTYIQNRLARTREAVCETEEQLAASKDPKDRKALADALWRLHEVEGYLANRPKPGSRRPGREKPSRESRSAAPLDGVE